MKPRGRDEDGTAEQVELEHACNTHAVEWMPSDLHRDISLMEA